MLRRLQTVRRELDEVEGELLSPVEPLHGSDPVAFAARLYRSRRMRERIFEGSLFAEPAWDVMLYRYVAQHEGRAVSVSSACSAASVPPTTGLRWLSSLEHAGHVVRRPQDRRTINVELTPDTLDRMTDLLLIMAMTLHP
jgi:DNA-binding MarR family transcriptional regulator